MALRAVPDHPKFADLKTRLGIPKYAALGILEALWHFTGRFTPRGNVGKYEDSAIAAWLEWPGDSSLLVQALVDSKWLHFSDSFRVVVHDWSQYADEMVQTTLARNCETFCDGSIPKAGRLNQHERDKFKDWLASQNSVASQPEVRQRSARGQTEVSQRSARGQTEVSQRSDSLTEVSATLPKPVPEPEPEPEPEPGARKSAALAPQNDVEGILRKIAEDCPDQQDFETGVDCAVRALMSSANPGTTLRTMQDNLPLWWAAMREGRARTKPMRYVIVDKDYLRPPADAVEKKKRPHWSD